MERLLDVKYPVLAALATVGAGLLRLLGGWDATLQTLVGLMVADYLTGVLAAAVFRRSPKTEGGGLSSGAGFKGLARKCAVLLGVFLATLLDQATGAGFVRTAVCLFFSANEGLSVLENLGLMGVPYPRFLREMLEALRDKNDSGGEAP